MWRSGERQSAASGDRLQIAQDRHGLVGQGSPVGAPHLGARRRDGPDRAVEIELGPLCRPQFAGPRKEERHELERRPRGRLPIVGLDRAQQRAERDAVRHRRARRDGRRRQGAAKRGGRVRLRPCRGNGVSEHAADRRSQAASGFKPAALLCEAQDGQKVDGPNLRQRPIAEIRSGEREQPLPLGQRRGGLALAGELGDQFVGHRAEGVGDRAGCPLRQLAGRSRIDAGGERLAVLVAGAARVGEAEVRVGAEREELLFSFEAVGEPPQPGTRRKNPQLKPAPIAEFA